MKTFLILLGTMALLPALPAQTNSPVPETNTTITVSTVLTPETPAARPSERPPTDIFSDSGEFNLKSNIFVYRGNVRVDDVQMKLTSEVLTVEAPRQPAGKFYRVTAERNVVMDFTQEPGSTSHATAGKLVYTYQSSGLITNAFVEFSGSPVITNLQGVRELKGDLIVWDRILNTVYVTNVHTSIVSGSTNAPHGFSPLGEQTRRTNSPATKPPGTRLRP